MLSEKLQYFNAGWVLAPKFVKGIISKTIIYLFPKKTQKSVAFDKLVLTSE